MHVSACIDGEQDEASSEPGLSDSQERGGADDIRSDRPQPEADPRRVSEVADDPGFNDSEGNRHRQDAADGAPARKLCIAGREPNAANISCLEQLLII